MNIRVFAATTLALAFGMVGLDSTDAAAAPTTRIATWNVEARDAGGRAGGSLFSDGSATGSGELAHHSSTGGAITSRIRAVSWTALSPNTYGIHVELEGEISGVRCIVLHSSDGGPELGVSLADDGICANAEPESDIAGKVTLLP
ncbi:hypothetical protein [Nocardia nepalensis]|uniref:hypothetical protein n=1 Tax=Nocardia nepalensis TaxID=3375448 RepID=UPI003B6703A3